MGGGRIDPAPGGFLGRLAPADRSALLELGHVHHYRKGSRIIVQGDHSDTVFVVIDGWVKVTLDTADGREIVLAILGRGELLGEFEAVEPERPPRTASNVALGVVECRVIAGSDFRAYLASHPATPMIILATILQRLRAADRRRIDAGSLDTAHRLASYLLELAGNGGGSDTPAMAIELPLTQQEIASLIAASRDSVVRALTSLRSLGLITTSRRRIAIVDLDGLRRFAGGEFR